MSSFLPSEVSRLVLGYLDEVECKSAYTAFLNECPHLAECRGRIFFTQIMGYSLVEILDDFCAVQSYFLDISRGEEFRRSLLKCKSLLDKVKLLSDNVNNKKSNAINKCHKPTSPHAKMSQSYSVHKSNRVRSNSCDSVVSTRTDMSGYGTGRLMDKRQPQTRSMESLAEATSLADLPGNKRCSIGCQTKTQGSVPTYKNYKDSSGKLDKTYRSTKCESEEESFKSALGLVRHSNLEERHNISTKTPLKGKSMGRKQGAVIKKTTHTPDALPNESLSVTTITHALLDCTEFHEKLAENINKIYSNLSTNKIKDQVDNLAISPNKTENAMNDGSVLANEGVLVPVPNSAPNVDDNVNEDVPQLDTVIKSIVEKTEKDPIFDQLVNEVLAAASVDSSSASDSDLISRPSTSTPEKSSYSQMNEESSPTWRSDAMQYPADKTYRPHFGGKKIHSNYRDKLRSRRLSPIKHTPYVQQQYCPRNKKYQRYPRGGKRMDVLRETYASSFCENEEEDLSVVQQQQQQHKSTVSITELDTPSTSTASKTEPKVVILSDEIVNTNIKTCKGQLIELPHIISVCKPEETIIKSCKDINQFSHVPVNVVPSQTDPRLQGRATKANERLSQPMILKTVKSFDSNQNMANVTPNPIRYVNVEQNKTIPLLEVMPQVINVQSNNLISFDGTTISQSSNVPTSQCGLRTFRKSYNFNPKLETDQKGNNFYSESDIMKMPTVFLGSPNKVEDSQTFTSAISDSNQASSVLPVQQPIDIGSQEIFSVATASNNAIVAPSISTQSKAKLIYREKVPLKSIPEFIKTMVNDTSGTHVLQIDQSLMGLATDSVLPPQSEIIIATRSVSQSMNVQSPANESKIEEHVNIENLPPNHDSVNSVRTEGKTPDNSTVLPKTGSTTPKRTLSHVRVLDFNTPPKSFTEGRKAFSSPKMSTRSMDNANRRPFFTPSSTTRSKSKRIQSKLFPSIAESPNDEDVKQSIENSDVVKVEVIASGVWDEVQGVGQILKKSNELNTIQNVENSKIISITEKTNKKPSKSRKKIKVLKPVEKKVEKPVEKKPVDKKSGDKKPVDKKSVDEKPVDKEPSDVKPIDTEIKINDKEIEERAAALEWARIRNANKRDWDHEMRIILSDPPKVESTKSRKKKSPASEKSEPVIRNENEELSKSTEDEGKLLEDALNKSTGLTPGKLNDVIYHNEDPNKLEGNIDEQTYDNFNSENNSCQSEVRSDEANTGNKDYLLQVKLFRDSMKTQQAEPCKFVTYSNPHKSNVPSPTKKQKKTTKVKNTFKVKFAAKNSKEISVSDDDSMDEVEDTTNVETQDNVETNPQESEAVSIPVVDSESAKLQPMLTPVEPPVPSVKITPDIPREHDFNPLNAKCNLNLLLETPFKFEILDLHMDTPKFISPGFFKNSLSSIKISDIPTPSFPFLPELTKTPVSMGKDPTPGSYSSRPTDYSSSSSYYKPDEIEFNLDVNGQLCATKESPKRLSVLKEETESMLDVEEPTTRVLRPRRSRTIYYPETLNRSKVNTSLNNSNEKSNTSKASNRTDTSKLDGSKGKDSVRSDEAVYSKSPTNNFNLSTSASSYDSFVDSETEALSTLIKCSSTPNVNKEKEKQEETRKQLEEKRRRVLSKLKVPTSTKKKSYPKTKVSIKGKRISNKLSLHHPSTSKTVPVKTNVPSSSANIEKELSKKETNVISKETNTQIKSVNSKSRRKSSTPRKLMKSEIGTFISPQSVSDGEQQQIKSDEHKSEIKENLAVHSKVESVKDEVSIDNENIIRSDAIESKFDTNGNKTDIIDNESDITSKKDVISGDVVTENVAKIIDNTDMVNKSAIVDNQNVVDIMIKDSDPGGHNVLVVETENINSESTASQITAKSDLVDNSVVPVDKFENVSNIENATENLDDSSDTQQEKETSNADVDVYDEYVSLHLSSDELETEPAKNIQPTETNMSNDEIGQIRDFIANTNISKDNSAFKENLLKQGFNRTSVEALEIELSETPSSDAFEIKWKETQEQQTTAPFSEIFSGGVRKSPNSHTEDSSKHKSKNVSHKKHRSENETKHKNVDKHKDSKSTEKHSKHKTNTDPNKYKKIEKKLKSLFNTPDKIDPPRRNSTDSEEDIGNIRKCHKKLHQSSKKHLKDRKKSHYTPSKISPRKSFDSKRTFVSPSHRKSPSLRKSVTPHKSPRKSTSPLKLAGSPKLSTKLSFAQYKEKRKLKEIESRKEEMKIRKEEVNKSEANISDKEFEKSHVKDVPVGDESKKDTSSSTLHQDNEGVTKSLEPSKNESGQSIEEKNIDDSEEEVVVWTNYNCDALSSDFISYKYVSSKNKRKPVKPCDVSRFKIKASVFNSLTEEDEVRDIEVTKHTDLFEMLPDRLMLQRLRRREAKIRRASEIEKEKVEASVGKRDPLEIMINEMENKSESQSSLEEINSIQRIEETDMAVKSILFDETSNHPFFNSPSADDPSSTQEHQNIPDQIIIPNKTSDLFKEVSNRIEREFQSDSSFKTELQKVESSEKTQFKDRDESDECADVSHSSKSANIGNLFFNNSASVSGESAGVAEKRKREDDLEEENLKKNKLSSPQTLLMKIDIDAVLSKLHGPK